MYSQLTIICLIAVTNLVAQTEWRGGGYDNEFRSEFNWTRGLPSSEMPGIIGPGAEVVVASPDLQNISIHQTGGVVLQHRGTMSRCAWLMDGGSFSSSNLYHLTIDFGSLLTLNDGEFLVSSKLRLGSEKASYLRVNGGKVRIDQHVDLRAGSVFTMTGGIVELGGNLNLFDQDAKVVITGGRFEAGQLMMGNNCAIVIGGEAQVVFRDSVVGGIGLGEKGNATLDFRVSSPLASLTIKGGPNKAYRTMWDNDRLLLYGQSKSDLNGLSFHSTQFRVSGSNDETLSVVPEPAAAGLFAAALLGVTLWRRRPL